MFFRFFRVQDFQSLGPGFTSSQEAVEETYLVMYHLLKISGQSAKRKVGQSVITQTSRVLDDDLLVELTDEDLQNIQYHGRTCYSRYKRPGERHKTTEVAEKRSNLESSIVSKLSSTESRHKRRKTHTEKDAKRKPCIICDKVKCKDSNERFRIEDTKRAVNFLNAYNFNKDVVYTRCILHKSAKDFIGGDIMYQL